MNSSKTLLLFVCGLALFCAPVTANPLSPLAVDTTTLGGIWHGSTYYNAGTGLEGWTDWAVWAPNTFPAGFSGYSAPAGEYIYAYQGEQIGAAPLSELKVLLQTTAGNQGSFTGNNGFGLVAGDPPNLATFMTLTDAVWGFDGVLPGTTTAGLVFASPYGPTLLSGTVTDHGSSTDVIPLPSPLSPSIPEPATLTLASCGLVVFAFGLLRRRGRKSVA